jgi:beta-lactamase superfamily II metal-dependent hydrolase
VSVLQRLKDIGSDVFRTDRSGALILNIRNGKGTITEWIAPFEGGSE